jgi:hypothetical protein
MSLAHRTREAIQVPGDALPARVRPFLEYKTTYLG